MKRRKILKQTYLKKAVLKDTVQSYALSAWGLQGRVVGAAGLKIKKAHLTTLNDLQNWYLKQKKCRWNLPLCFSIYVLEI